MSDPPAAGQHTRIRLSARDLRRRQSRPRVDFVANGAVVREVESRLIEHLDVVKLHPVNALSMGADSQEFRKTLANLFPRTDWITMTTAKALLKPTKPRWPWQKRAAVIGAPDALPLCNDTLDMIVSNLLASAPDSLPGFITEAARTLRADGLIALSLLGPDTFREFADAWADVDETPHTAPFLDMHEVGDHLVKQGFTGVVMDAEKITVTYEDVMAAVKEMRCLGLGNTLSARARGLTSQAKWQRVVDRYTTVESRVPVTLELVYAHAWRGTSRRSAAVTLELN